ncbi:glycosyltransferase family 4 protein [Actinomadura kijaniata]|uniref:Glycosyltransferase involved in cell wall biosynthesis n=1 Tax=Actinomadura namibiensis TaxID=182080 RepID=A0A7W3QJ12_ACTNM|nr:glycosyltransferase family 4 protein [Actinomadura namibiensis]MBA8948792.1 glycosyltransferase involved in cell wall biosynthesis [Actinomadura namibiensis]
MTAFVADAPAVRGPVTGEVCFVLPGDVDDAALPSGGNVYDRRMCDELPARGWRVREIAVPGGWPRPDREAREALERALAALPDGTAVVLDGLVACGVPQIVVPAARRLRTMVLVHLPLGDEVGAPPELEAAERDTLRWADAVVTTGEWAAGRLIRRHRLEPARIHVVPPGTDPAPLALGTDGATQLLCVGSVTPRKGHDLLIEALAGLAGLDWECVVVGPLGRDPGYAGRVRELITRRGLDRRVRLAGALVGEALANAYDTADLLVFPSRAETYGMAAAEALARGVPVAAAEVGGVPEALGRAPGGDVPGLLVPPDNVSALEDALRRWLTDRGLRLRLRSAARLRRDGLRDWTEAASRMAAALERLCGEAR